MNKDSKIKLRVLIVEDDEDDYIIIKHYLNKISSAAYEVFWTNTYEDAVKDILADAHDIYLIDHFLGKGEGVEIIETVRSQNFYKPLILLTGAGNREVDEKAMEKGASDYLVKTDLKVDMLERALRYANDRYLQQRYINEQEQKYRSLFELSREPLLLLDKSFSIIEFNNAFQGLFDFGENGPYHKNFQQLFEYAFDVDYIQDKIKKQGFVRGFKTNITFGGKTLTVVLSMAKLADAEVSKEAMYQVAVSDVSRLIEAQEELKKAEKLSMTGRMARMIAHEVRNPLTNINLASGELEELCTSLPESKLYLDMIARNASRISGLIDDLLQSARPPQLEMANTNMQKVLDSAIEACKDRISLQGVNFHKVYPSELVTGKWDPEKLQIAFVNIIINAVEAMKEVEKPELSLILTKEKERPTIFIKDNGVGMDEETKSKLFDPFFTNRKGGLGLGMTATLNIIAMHEGKISVTSNHKQGTEFKVVL
jgi:PAS domain S-box-containing protein